MTNDPLIRLRRQLVDAAELKAATGNTRRFSRRALWTVTAVAVMAVPAAAAATGVIDLGSGTASDGSTYTISRITDSQSAGNPATTDGIGRTCEVTTYRDNNGALQGRGMQCRPAGTNTDGIVGAGFDLLPNGELLVKGTAARNVAKITISGVDAAITLTPDPQEDRQRFSAITTTETHTVTAYDADGKPLAQNTITPG